jgi:flagellar biogenesis protein FliO
LAPNPPGSDSRAVVPAAYEQPITPGNPASALPSTNRPKDNFPRSEADRPVFAATPQSESRGSAQPLASHSAPPVKSEPSASPGAAASHEPSLVIGNHANHGSREKPSGASAVVTMGSSLAVVLGLFFLIAWAMRKASPRGSVVLPGEVFEVLGRAPLTNRQQVHLLRCGSKLLLVSITPAGTETLTEVCEPVEVDRLAGLCRAAHPNSATSAFRQVFQQFAPRSGSPKGIESLETPSGERPRSYSWEDDNV